MNNENSWIILIILSCCFIIILIKDNGPDDDILVINNIVDIDAKNLREELTEENESSDKMS